MDRFRHCQFIRVKFPLDRFYVERNWVRLPRGPVKVTVFTGDVGSTTTTVAFGVLDKRQVFCTA